MEAVPHTLPALWRAEKIVSRSVKAGFNWDSVDGALDKLDEEAAELRQAVEAGEAVDSPMASGRRSATHCSSSARSPRCPA